MSFTTSGIGHHVLSMVVTMNCIYRRLYERNSSTELSDVETHPLSKFGGNNPRVPAIGNTFDTFLLRQVSWLVGDGDLHQPIRVMDFTRFPFL